jgi:ABC-type ATPase with predicted acetyltransferase domain
MNSCTLKKAIFMDTHVFQIQKHFPLTHTITRRMGQLMNLFGLTLGRLQRASFRHALDIQLRPGDICYITGPSGAGKSVLLRQMIGLVPDRQRICLEDIGLESNQSLIDSIEGPLLEAVDMLSRAGLSDALAMLQTPALLSVGQQFRYRLAKALLADKTVVFADEFMASVESITAVCICRQLRSIATKTQKIFIFAGVHDHFIPDLCPDVVVVKSSHGPAKVIWQDSTRGKNPINH